MKRVEYEGQQGWFDEASSEFLPDSDWKESEYEGQAGLFNPDTSEFVSTTVESQPKNTGGVTGSWKEEESFTKELPELTGGITGGLLAAKKASLPAMAISALGGAGGEGYHQIYQHIMQDPNAPQDVKDAVSRMLSAAGTQAIGEGTGRVVAGAISKVAAPFAKTLKPEVAESDAMLKAAMGREVGLTAAQKTDSHIIDTLENVAEQSFTGGDTMMRFRGFQDEGYKKITDSLLSDFEKYTTQNATPEEVGIIFQNAKAAKDAVYKRLAGMKYSRVDKMAGGASVSLSPIKNEAATIMETASKRRGIGGSDAKDALLKKVLELDDSVTFKEAQAIRAGLLDEISSMSAKADIGKGMARKFVSLIDNSMETSAKKLSPEAYKSWRDANQFYREYKGLFGNDFMHSLDKIAQNAPEKVVDKVFQKGAITQIRNVKSIVSGKTFNDLKAAYLRKIMQESLDDGGTIIGEKMGGKLKGMGDSTLKEIFTVDELQRIRNVATLGTQMQKKIGGGGGMLVQLMQASGLVGVATGLATGNTDLAGSGAAVLFGPYALSKMLTNPVTARYLTRGFRTPAGTKEAATITAKLLAEAAKYQIEKPGKQEPVTYE